MDRNIYVRCAVLKENESLSARRAWIEIGKCERYKIRMVSLSARRAWIEIALAPKQNTAEQRSLSARRAWIEIIMFVNLRVVDGCRSPQGERG